jgi:ribose transport system ATP-binding protein
MGQAEIIPSRVVVSVQNVSKTYGLRRVVDRISLDFKSGEVHALLGQNGSGKSTVIKILTGIVVPDKPADASLSSCLIIDGERHHLPVPPTLIATAGITAVHQDLPIVGSLSVLENLQIGRYRSGIGWRIDWRAERAEVQRALKSFGIQATPEQQAQELSAADRAMLAILRALRGLPNNRPGLLILDEPTAHLPLDGVNRVTGAIRKVASAGHAVLLVTHRLDEVFAISDRVTVIRDGEICLQSNTADLSELALIHAIVGFELKELYPEKIEHRGEQTFSVADLASDTVDNFCVSLRSGEIVGITGLVGAGHEELPYLLFGSKRAAKGSIALGKKDFSLRHITPQRAMRLGIAMLPNDRRETSGVGSLTIRENITAPILSRFFRAGRLRMGEERTYAAATLNAYGVLPPDPELLLETFSGGNQQKALLAKWLQITPSVLILHEPTQGVDVGARRTLFSLIEDAAKRGAAIIIVSSEYADLANVCDRVLVMRRGRLVGELAGENLEEQRIVAVSMVH